MCFMTTAMGGKQMDWKTLGYKADPITAGGRLGQSIKR